MNYRDRNFDGHLNRPLPIVDSSDRDMPFSDYLYDNYVGVSHMFVHTSKGNDDDIVRLVSDVEMMMSDDPLIRSHVSDAQRLALKNSFMAQPKSKTPSLTDEQLLSPNVIPSTFPLERDESLTVSRAFVSYEHSYSESDEVQRAESSVGQSDVSVDQS